MFIITQFHICVINLYINKSVFKKLFSKVKIQLDFTKNLLTIKTVKIKNNNLKNIQK